MLSDRSDDSKPEYLVPSNTVKNAGRKLLTYRETTPGCTNTGSRSRCVPANFVRSRVPTMSTTSI